MKIIQVLSLEAKLIKTLVLVEISLGKLGENYWFSRFWRSTLTADDNWQKIFTTWMRKYYSWLTYVQNLMIRTMALVECSKLNLFITYFYCQTPPWLRLNFKSAKRARADTKFAWGPLHPTPPHPTPLHRKLLIGPHPS